MSYWRRSDLILASCQPPEVPSLITERFHCPPLCIELEKETVPSKYTHTLTLLKKKSQDTGSS